MYITSEIHILKFNSISVNCAVVELCFNHSKEVKAHCTRTNSIQKQKLSEYPLI